MHVLPHGSYVRQYDVDADAAAARAALDLPPRGTVFAFVGAIRGYKGVAELVEAFTMSGQWGRDARLHRGKPLPARIGRELEERAATDPRVVLRLERIPEEDLSRVLRAADVVVLPFRDILTSGSAILALSHGRPGPGGTGAGLPAGDPAGRCHVPLRPGRPLCPGQRPAPCWPAPTSWLWRSGASVGGRAGLGADRRADRPTLTGATER